MVRAVYVVQYKKSVAKEIRKLPEQTRADVVAKIQALAINPHPTSATKLRGAIDLFRIRHGDYRIIYQIQDGQLIIIIIKVGHRREVYRDF